MFSSNKNNNRKESPITNNLLNIIGTGTKVTGDLASDGDIRVDGTIEGHVTVKQRLVLGEAGLIAGDIEALDAIVAGLLKGNIRVEQTLILKSSARIEGDITTDKIVIESGAQFNGRCTMNAQLASIPQKASTAVNVKARAKSE
ncbi:MAG: polymer-forming cytoskeletal protein [Bacteroidetes bacterium]|nr:polymer-forming cytoskeletal protein [Bacteroidota bacterium]